jgi:hypothetical protein
MIERARRVGWVLLLGAAGLAIAWRYAVLGRWALLLAASCGILGFLSVLNVLLIRALYRQIDAAPRPEDDGSQSM